MRESPEIACTHACITRKQSSTSISLSHWGDTLQTNNKNNRTMQHVTIKQLNEKFYSLTPDKGYKLQSKIFPYQQYSGATTDDPERNFKAVKD